MSQSEDEQRGSALSEMVHLFDRAALLGDIAALPKELRPDALAWFRRLARSPELGEPCGYASSTGNISDCMKFYFDSGDNPRVVALDTPERKLRHYRVVYRRVAPEGIEVIAVGPGHPPSGVDSVYVIAGMRLGRTGGR